jgi:hypothetical protein
MAKDEDNQSFAEKIFSKVAKQFGSGGAAEAHEQVKQRYNQLDEVARQLEEGDDPNSDIFEKEPFSGENF